MRKLIALLLCIMVLGGMTMAAHAEESTLDFFKSLNYEDGLSVVVDVFQRYPLQYATTLGLDGNPQIRPIEFKFEEDGVLYFDTVTFYTSYKELLAHPYIQLCVCDQETMTYVRLGGKVNFTLLLGGYEKEQTEINALIETEQAQLDSYEADSEKVSQFMALAKKYTDFSELTPQMIYEFVEKIIVHAPEKIDGERTQEVEIQLKYIGSFDLPESPLPDPTPEEIAAEEKKQRRRETNHRYYEKRKGQGQAAQKNEEEKSA